MKKIQGIYYIQSDTWNYFVLFIKFDTFWCFIQYVIIYINFSRI